VRCPGRVRTGSPRPRRHRGAAPDRSVGRVCERESPSAAQAYSQAAIAAGKNVAWSTLEQVGALVRRHRADDSVTKAIARILRADLVVIDDIGLLPVAPDAAEGLYRIVDAAYERRSVAVSSNLHPSGFDELMPKTLATATVDRLMHHAHVCQTSGDSIRLTQAIAGKGVIPLS